MKKQIITGLFLLVSIGAWSQKNEKPGWVKLNSGDTLKGTILVNEWNRNPSKIVFKQKSEITFTVSDIQSFGIPTDNLLYRRFSIERHLTPINESSDLPLDENVFDTATVWLKVLVIGKVPLAEYTNNERDYFYYIKNDKASELVYSKGIKVFDNEIYRGDPRFGSRSIIENQEYKKQIINLSTGDNELADINGEIRNLDYNPFSLTAIFNSMNKVQSFNGYKNKGHFFVGAGVTFISTNISGATTFLDNTAVINGANSLTVKVGYLLQSSKPNSKMAFIPEIGYVMYNTKGTKSSSISKGFKYDINNSYITPGLLMRYTVNPLNPVRFALNVGIVSFVSISNNNQTSEESLGGTINVSNDKPIFKSLFVTPTVGASLDLGMFNIFAEYKFTPNLTDYVGLTYKLNMVAVGVSFNLKK
jgi:hypothetical protein